MKLMQIVLMMAINEVDVHDVDYVCYVDGHVNDECDVDEVDVDDLDDAFLQMV